MTPSRDRELDVILFGATGFAGRLTARYLAAHAPTDLRVGIAGRSSERLAALVDALPETAAAWTRITADSADPDAMAALTERTQVVATTVGPYLKYGKVLAAACAQAGTDYADLTGETLFCRGLADAFHTVAQESGARVVNSCGFDSVPSDLAMLLAHDAASRDGAGEIEEATLVLRSASGGFSGGTIDTMRTVTEAVAEHPPNGKILADPYALSPHRDAEPDLGKQADVFRPYRDKDLESWVAPFVMASFNTRIVRRSNALQDWSYGRRLRYREVHGFGDSPLSPVAAYGVTAGLGVFAAGMQFGLTRPVLDRLLPAPGEGPSEATQQKGHFHVETVAHTAEGRRYAATVAAQGDPGYLATSVMLGESAMCLALDRDSLPPYTGVLTPATGMGMALVDRLRSAGFRLEVSSG